jgi:putative Mg2+ transporter-C (MgtC) family protein
MTTSSILADLVLSVPAQQTVLRLVAACGLGAMIGLEREFHGRSAGLRTHLLVSLGAAIAMSVALHFVEVLGSAGGSSSIRVDPSPIAYGVMAGVGFIGAGVIFHQGVGVRGLTTAASLWCSAGVGLACGFGMYLVAGVGTALVLFALVALDHLQRCLPGYVLHQVNLTLTGAGDERLLNELVARLEETSGKIVRRSIRRDFANNTVTALLEISILNRRRHRLEEALRNLPRECQQVTLE